ncbi:MAG: hypothetical protein Q8Q09_16150 [Deltaproteobacteria bacterium]|nr:hypothetical protein [Deltaproteobacteria bacterium]
MNPYASWSLAWLAAGLFACGARSNIDPETYAPWEPSQSLDAESFERDASLDRALSRPPRIARGCDDAALPAVRSVQSVSGPIRLSPVVLHDPTRQRALVVGGLPSTGMYTRGVYAVATADGQTRTLGVSAVELPIFAAVAWIDPPNTALMVGGSLRGGTLAASTVTMQVFDNTIQFAESSAHPGGPVWYASAVYDPARRGVIVHGGRGHDTADARLFRATWLVQREGSALRWRELVSASQSPPAADARIGGIDPRTGALVLLGGSTADGVDRSVWSLSAGESPRWTRLEGAADALPRSGHALSWDPIACGFLLVGGRCADQLWLIRPEGSGVREALLGSLGLDPVSVGLGRIGAGVVFDATQRSLLVVAGSVCDNSGGVIRANAVVELR